MGDKYEPGTLVIFARVINDGTKEKVTLRGEYWDTLGGVMV